jgi:RimJ/RimL family protein N-acetyltransferase
MEAPTVVTERLILRSFTEQDSGALYRIMNEDDVLRYFPNSRPPAPETVERLIGRRLQHWQEHGYGWWAVELREQPGLIGWNGLQYLPDTDEVEVGYLLSRENWGRGLAVEGACEGLRYGFEKLGLGEIVGIVHPENLASQRVLEKLGMVRTAETEYFGMAVYRYAINAAAYSRVRGTDRDGIGRPAESP